jgi:hypothetical protein
MHAYCVGALGLSEDSAWKRIRVARLARAFPEVLDMIADGRVHLSAVVLLSPHLTRKNAAALFAAATQKTKRQIEASGRAIPAAGRAGAGPGHRAGARSPETGPGASPGATVRTRLERRRCGRASGCAARAAAGTGPGASVRAAARAGPGGARATGAAAPCYPAHSRALRGPVHEKTATSLPR